MTTTAEGELVVEAAIAFPPPAAAASVGSMPFQLTLYGDGEVRVSSLVHVPLLPASVTDVVRGSAELVTTAGLLLTRWVLQPRDDDTILAQAEMSPLALRPFAPLRCVVRLFAI